MFHDIYSIFYKKQTAGSRYRSYRIQLWVPQGTVLGPLLFLVLQSDGDKKHGLWHNIILLVKHQRCSNGPIKMIRWTEIIFTCYALERRKKWKQMPYARRRNTSVNERERERDQTPGSLHVICPHFMWPQERSQSVSEDDGGMDITHFSDGGAVMVLFKNV